MHNAKGRNQITTPALWSINIEAIKKTRTRPGLNI